MILSLLIDVMILALGTYYALTGIYVALLVVSFWLRRMRRSPLVLSPAGPLPRIRILIPAHNEERYLPTLLGDIDGQDYSRQNFQVAVLAHRCNDQTANIARAKGAEAWENNDDHIRDKPSLLKHYFANPKFLAGDFDYLVVVDADCRMQKDFISQVAANLQAHPARVAQSTLKISNERGSPLASVTALAYVLIHEVRNGGKVGVGGNSGLFGNGIILSKQQIIERGWPAESLAEDYEYFIRMTLENLPVRFYESAILLTEGAERFSNHEGQKIRWELGFYNLIRAFLPLATGAFLRGPSLRRFFLIFELLCLPFVAWVLGLFALNVLVFFHCPYGFRGLGIASAMLIGVYVASGASQLKEKKYFLRSLAFVPIFLFWKIGVIFQILKKRSTVSWVKTDRNL